MTTQDIIDHLKAGRPVTAKVVKEIVVELEFSRKQDAELKRLLAMQSDLDLQGYEHPRDELQELRDKLEAAGKNGRELSASCCPFLNNNGLYSDEYGHTRCHAKERVKALEEALTEIRDYDPYKNPDAQFVEKYSAAIKETESCLDCKRARENRWPPSGLCSIHYRTVTRAREAVDSVFDHNQKYEPQNIARRVLLGELK